MNTRSKCNVPSFNSGKITKSIKKKSVKVMITLSQREKEYIESLGKKEVEKIVNIFSNNISEEPKPIRMSVLMSSLPDDVKMRYFNTIPFNDSDKYLTLVKSSMEIPFNKVLKPPNMKTKNFLDNANLIMNNHITGNTEAKQEILKILCQWKDGIIGNNYAIGLEGKPGTGKTTFAKHAVSEATGLPLVSIGLGGCQDASYLMGNSYTYEGSTYGRMVGGLIESGCSNPIFFFDELDKVSASAKGEEIINTLIHLIDRSQNSDIRDKYFSFDIDFSKCTFIFSYNDKNKISPILLDRIKNINVETPTREEKFKIIKNNILPKCLETVKKNITLDDDVINYVLSRNEEECGMRSIEKDIEHLVLSANLTKAYGSLSIIGIEKSYTVKNSINIEFAMDVLKKKKGNRVINMMYT